MARLRGEFRAYPALPDPGVPDDLDHLTFAPACALEDGFERRDLVVPADELREAALAREFEPGPLLPTALEFEHALRVLRQSEVESSEIPEFEEPAGEQRGRLRQVDVTGFGEALHPFRHAHRGPEGRVTARTGLSDPGRDDGAGVEPDPDRKRQALGAPQLGGIIRKRVAGIDRCMAGALRVVLLCDRCAE